MFCQKCGYDMGNGKYCPKCGLATTACSDHSVGESPAAADASRKLPWWQRLLGGWNPSSGWCFFFLIIGVLINGLGLAYYQAYIESLKEAAQDPGSGAGVVGAIIGFAGNFIFYLGVAAWLDKMKPANSRRSFGAKILAVFLWLCAFIILNIISMVLRDGRGLCSIWDFLILFEICRAIWKGTVGPKRP